MRINQLIIASLKSEAGEAELRELEAWRSASPENERHYQEFVALWNLAEGSDDIATGQPPAVMDLVEGHTPSGHELVRLEPPTRRVRAPVRIRRWSRRWAAAAAVLVLGFGLWNLATSPAGPPAAALADGADEFVTGSSETGTVGLRDGTVVRLAPSTRLVLSGTTEHREVALKGRAYFAVVPDESRPFRIRADAGTVTVLGTRFDLQSEGDDLRLIVVEGRVALAAGGRQVEVHAGEMSRILAGTLVPTVRIPDIFSMVDWLGTFLAFQATPLPQAAREIERAYGVRIELTDASLADRTVTGWFSDRRLDEVLRIVCAVVAAQCITEDDVVRIAPLPDGIVVDTALSSRR